jgi:hypothetical protein
MKAAVESLQNASKEGLTREKLLDLIIDAPNEIRMTALVSMTRSGLDYEFFRILSERIDQAQGEEKEKLTQLRDRLNQLTQEIDKRLAQQMDKARATLNKILDAADIEEAVSQAIPEIDDFFAEVLREETQKAREANNQDRIAKLQKLVDVIQQASTPPADFALAEELMGAENDAARREILEAHADEITPEFLQMLSQLVAQLDQQGQKEVAQRLQESYRSALRFSMEANLKK